MGAGALVDVISLEALSTGATAPAAIFSIGLPACESSDTSGSAGTGAGAIASDSMSGRGVDASAAALGASAEVVADSSTASAVSPSRAQDQRPVSAACVHRQSSLASVASVVAAAGTDRRMRTSIAGKWLRNLAFAGPVVDITATCSLMAGYFALALNACQRTAPGPRSVDRSAIAQPHSAQVRWLVSPPGLRRSSRFVII